MLATMQSQHLTPCCSDPTPYADDDEVRCRSCHRSLSHPRRTPGDDDAASVKGENLAVAGIARTGKRTTKATPAVRVSCVKCRLQTSGVRLNCPSCEQVLVVLKSTTRALGEVYVLPPFTAPRLLRCSCCQELLPQFCYSVRNNESSRNREFRASQCRGCMAFRLRVRREQNPDGVRARDRARQGVWYGGLSVERKATLTKTPKADNNAAVRRYYARTKGRKVMKQARGRSPILLKPICRVADSCPLRSYCTVESKGLG